MRSMHSCAMVQGLLLDGRSGHVRMGVPCVCRGECVQVPILPHVYVVVSTRATKGRPRLGSNVGLGLAGPAQTLKRATNAHKPPSWWPPPDTSTLGHTGKHQRSQEKFAVLLQAQGRGVM